MTEKLGTVETSVLLEEESSAEKVVDQTNAVIGDTLDEEVLSPSRVIEKIKELNPDVKIETDILKTVIFSSAAIEDLVLPEGFYCYKGRVTNKYNTQIGEYCKVHVYPLSYYNPDMF